MVQFQGARPGNLTSEPSYVGHALKVVDKWVSYQRFVYKVPSVSIGVFAGRKIIFRGAYGYSDLKTKKPATSSTCYRIASISKLFTATAIMQLADEGKIQLDDPAARYLSPFRRMSGESRRTTVRQIMAHLSGMTRDGNTPHWSDARFPVMKDMIRQLAGKTTYFPPLERFKYSNFAYGLLGDIIEKAAGSRYKSYREYIERRIFGRLRLANTAIDFDEGLRSRMATGYSRLLPGRSRKTFEHYKTRGLAPATGFVSNVDDLCKFLMTHMSGGNPLISKLAEREMQRPNWMSEDGSHGYGIGFQIWKLNDRFVLGHSGGFQGFISRMGMDTKSKLGVVVLTNSQDGPAQTLMEGIFHTFRYFEANEDKFKTKEVTPKALRRYEGGFSGRWSDVEVAALGRRLFVLDLAQKKPMEASLELRHIRGDEFRIEQGNEYDYIGESVKFEFDRQGEVRKIRIGPNPIPLVLEGKLWK